MAIAAEPQDGNANIPGASLAPAGNDVGIASCWGITYWPEPSAAFWPDIYRYCTAYWSLGSFSIRGSIPRLSRFGGSGPAALCLWPPSLLAGWFSGLPQARVFYFLDLDNQNPMVVIPNIPYLIFVLAVALFATITSLVLARNLFRYVFQQIVMGSAVFILLIPNLALAQG